MKVKAVGRILLGLALSFTGIGHLTFSRQDFKAQVPSWLPLDADFVVIVSGIVEISLGLALIFVFKYQKQIGAATAIFFVLIFPGNISQYLNGIDAFGLDSDQARLTKLFFQPLLVLWALWSTNALQLLKNKRSSSLSPDLKRSRAL
jgi:Predicted membrane protein